MLDRAGDIVLHNPASGEIWGDTIVPGAERWVKTKGFWHHSGKAIEPGEWASHRALDDGQTVRDELIDIVNFAGAHKTIENYAAPIRDTRVYGTNADITERKRADEELARRNQRLEALSRRLIEAQEAERRAVARELHDDFGRVLHGATAQSRATRQRRRRKHRAGRRGNRADARAGDRSPPAAPRRARPRDRVGARPRHHDSGTAAGPRREMTELPRRARAVYRLHAGGTYSGTRSTVANSFAGLHP